MNTTPDALTTAHANLGALRSQLKAAFVQRDEEVDALLTALIAGEHALLLGPPGTAKSALTNCLAKALDSRFFATLLTKHTTPEEVFGPWNLPALKSGKYERITTGRFPEAEVGFLDEVFKSSSAMLNGFLTALNEREFDNGGVRHKIPLIFCVGASNELPQDDSLGALYDRFLVRRWVTPASTREARRRILSMRGDPADLVTARVSRDDLATLRAAVATVDDSGVVEPLLDVAEALMAEEIVVSDRRWRKAIKLVRARCVLDGRSKATVEDVIALADALWDEPEDRAKVYGACAGTISPDFKRALEILDSATEMWTAANLDTANLDNADDFKRVADLNAALKGMINEAKKLDLSGPAGAEIEKVRSMGRDLARRMQKHMGSGW